MSMHRVGRFCVAEIDTAVLHNSIISTVPLMDEIPILSKLTLSFLGNVIIIE